MTGNGKSDLPTSLRDFLAELEDLVEALNRDISSLEDLLGSGGEDPDLINSLFRSFHTIKGLAGMLSLGDINVLAHSLEDLLDSVRLGKVELNDELLEVLAKGVEILGQHAEAITTGKKAPTQGEFIKRLEKVAQSRQDGAGTSLAGKINLRDEVLKTLTEYEEHRLKENIKNNKNIFIIHKGFSFENFDNELNALLAALKTDGEVISTLPSSSADDPMTIRFDLLWSTQMEPEEIITKFKLTGGELSAIEYEKSGVQRAAEKETAAATLRSISDTVRVDIKRLDNLMNIVGELVIYKTHLGEITRDFVNRSGLTTESLGLTKTVKALERSLNFLQKGVIEARMVPIGQMFGKLNRVVRKLSRDLNKDVELRIYGEDTELDKLVIEDMADPLLHLIRNAIDHGVEPPEARRKKGKPERGIITLSASQKGNHIIIEIEDDGAGIDAAKVRKIGESKGLLERGMNYDEQHIFSLLFMPGFSTTDKVTEVSGRGVGLDVVKNNVSRLRGMIDLSSAKGEGTKVSITLPMTLAIIQSLMVRVAEETFAIPISSVLESIKLDASQIHKVENREVVKLRESILPLIRLDDFFRLKRTAPTAREGGYYVVVVGLAEKRLGLVVDSLRGQQEVVIKTLGKTLKPVKGIAGATELGDRRAVLVLDVGGLIQEATFAE